MRRRRSLPGGVAAGTPPPASRLDRLLAELAQAPPEDDPEFAFEVRRALRATYGDDRVGIDADIDRALGRPDRGRGSRISFLLLYAQLLTNWELNRYERYRALVRRYAGEFDADDHPYIHTFRAQAQASLGASEEELEGALEHAVRAKNALPHSRAVLNLYAFLVFRTEELRDEPSDRHVRAALDAVDLAIELDAQAQRPDGRWTTYYATKANLLALQGRFREAHRQLDIAWSLVEPDPIRDAKFERVRGTIEQLRLRRRLQLERERLLERVEQANQLRVEVVQVLGLLAAVIAFLVAGLQLGTNLRNDVHFDDAARLMLVTTGAILFVFSGFSLVFVPRPPRMVLIAFACLAVSAGIVATALFAMG